MREFDKPFYYRQVRATDRVQFEQQKRDVQAALRQRLRLRANEPRAGGSGNSNDGNTARRAFRSSAKFAACPGVDERLIQDLHVILQAISRFHRLDTSALASFCRRTAQRYVELYGWFPMPTTLHRLLAHSAEVVKSCHLPIGMMSEEAAEAANKRVRQYRLRHTRKDTRLHTMSDLVGYLLVASDPLLSSIGLQRRRDLYTRRQGTLLPGTLAMLAEPQLSANGNETGDRGGGSSSSSDSVGNSGGSSSSSDDDSSYRE